MGKRGVMKLDNIIGIYNKDGLKVLNILGIKIKFTNKKAAFIAKIRKELKQQQRNTARLLTISRLHEKTFFRFKGVNKNKTMVLLGAGPTLNHFEPIENAMYVGLNRTFLFDKVQLDYLFAIDKVGIQDYYREFIDYGAGKCIKFIGDQNMGINYQIPEYVAEDSNALRYKTNIGMYPHTFTVDIDSEPLGNFCTVSLQAMQFMLYTRPKRIYIVGIDCNMSKAGHFVGKSYDCSKRNENSQQNDDNSIKYWAGLNNFVQTYYPDTEVISVNPVGLRGIFKEVWTESYLKEHPEIREELGENIEILNSKEVVNV